MSSTTQDASTTQPPASVSTHVPPPPPDPAQLMALIAIRVKNDHDAVTHYAAILAGIMSLFIISNLFGRLGRKSGLQKYMATSRRLFNFITRLIVRVFIRLLLLKVPGAPSLGHAVLVTTYLGLNICFIFVYVDDSVMLLHAVVASRVGWLSIINICLTVFLSLKNTPLGPLAGWSYERLNVLHRVSGFTSFVLVVAHGASYSSFFLEQQDAARLRVNTDIFGMVAGFAILSVVTIALTLQRRRYELFYILHLFFFMISLIFISLHHPTAATRVVIAVGVAAGMWLLDRLVRASRLVYYGINNAAALAPLPYGGTRVILNKKLIGAKSGEHAFLWIPGIRTFETHPFTITSTEPLEFIIASQDGFTRDLHQYALKNPGAILKASVEGPYGQIPDPNRYDKVLIFAGGSGGSFAVGTALRILRSFKGSSKRDVTLVWTFRDYGLLEWFSAHLSTIAHAEGFKLSIHITGQKELEKPSTSGPTGFESSDRSEGPLFVEEFSGKTATVEIEIGTRPVGIERVPINLSRPDIDSFIAEAVEGMAFHESVLVMGCGPSGLLQELRKSTTFRMGMGGPQVYLHCEQFGW